MAENKTLPVGCVIMASGLSTRFGSNKLLTPFGPGREPMLRRAFAATDTPLLASRVVVARSPEVETLCREVSVPCLLHALPGRNDTVRLGLEALLAERPDPTPLVGSPVLFDSGYFPALRTLPEGKGGSFLLRQYPEQVHCFYTAHHEELWDADTPEALQKLEAML